MSRLVDRFATAGTGTAMRTFAALTIQAAGTVASAHPGHGADGGSHSPLHYATEAPHSTVSVLGVVAIASAGLILAAAPAIALLRERYRRK